MKAQRQLRDVVYPTKRYETGLQARIKSVRSLSTSSILLSTGLDVAPISQQFFFIVDKWIACEGKRSAVLRLKNVYLASLRSMVGDPIELPFLKTNVRGFPKTFGFLEKFWIDNDRSPQAMQAVLSLLTYYRGILAPGTPDLSSITNEGKEIPNSLIDEIIEKGWDPNWTLSPKKLPPARIQMRYKKGPNGQSTIESFRDLAVMPKELVDSIIKLLKLSDDSEDYIGMMIPRIVKALPKEVVGHHSRLAVKREKGGKDRVFAMVDYWTQLALEPLHHGLGDILRTMSEDCTFDQSKGVSRIKQWTTTSKAISIDLSSASDRFPMILQKKILEKLVGSEEFVECWSNLMVNRDFYYKGKTYRWSVGQPLGAHSSWPSFALAHHVVMRAAHSIAGIDHKDRYLILGDDMAAENSPAIPVYLDLLDKLGVEISSTKGLKACSCEFAKRIFWKGIEVSPIPAPYLTALLKDEYLLSEFIGKVTERSSTDVVNLRVSAFSDQYSSLTSTDKEKCLILCTYPIPLMRSILKDVSRSEELTKSVQWNTLTIPMEELIPEYNRIKVKYTIQVLDRLQRSGSRLTQSLQGVELPSTPKGIQRMHPIFYSQQSFVEQLTKARRELSGYLASRDLFLEPPKVYGVIEMSPGSRKTARHSGKFLLELYNSLSGAEHRALPGA